MLVSALQPCFAVPSISRRQYLTANVSWALVTMAIGGPSARGDPLPPRLAAAQPFSFDWLRKKAKELAAKPYVAEPPPAPDIVGKIDFDVTQKIRFRPDRALWANGPGPFPVRLFHLNKFNGLPVRINAIAGGMARRVLYSPQDFDYGATGLGEKIPADLGYSGFRVMDGRHKSGDWLAFQGASYFRSAGEGQQYGASARGIAVNTALSAKEEFPRFTEFWLAEPEKDTRSITAFALLDGPSLTGAYRFKATQETGAVIDVTAELFMRRDIARLGIAPLTSMYWYGENDRRAATDWRPEIHDSDGLALWTGRNERIWRPLVNPPSVRANSFLDVNPKGFGLMQRDRDFANYQDGRTHYHRRPSVWVEPLGDWGEGAVQLIEIPTRDETRDNVVVYWQPKRTIKDDDHLALSYRLHWRNDEPHPPKTVGRVVATRTGAGGPSGRPAQEERTARRFVIDFAGGPLTAMTAQFDVKPVIGVSRGKIANAYAIRVAGTEKWRALFDLRADGKEPINLRCYLRLADRTLTETWLYQYSPAG